MIVLIYYLFLYFIIFMPFGHLLSHDSQVECRVFKLLTLRASWLFHGCSEVMLSATTSLSIPIIKKEAHPCLLLHTHLKQEAPFCLFYCAHKHTTFVLSSPSRLPKTCGSSNFFIVYPLFLC